MRVSRERGDSDAEYVPEAGIPADVYVGGGAAEQIDFSDLAKSWTPRVFVFVLSLSFILLTIAFRSLVVPIKAILMNLLSVGAAYSLLVLVFQRGVGADLLGFQQAEAIETDTAVSVYGAVRIVHGLSRVPVEPDQRALRSDT